MARWTPAPSRLFQARAQASEIAGFPFLRDIEVQVRLLLVLPILIVAELIVHLRIRDVVKRFVLLSFRMEVAGLVALMLLLLCPLVFFTPQLAAAKRRGLADYAILANRYVMGFDRKWIQGGAGSEEVLGSADIQSPADLGNSYGLVQQMGVVPFGLKDIGRLAATTAVPLLPLALTIFPWTS